MSILSGIGQTPPIFGGGGGGGIADDLAGGAGGSIPYQIAVNNTTFLANGSAGEVLTSQGGTLAPIWSAPTASATQTFTTSFTYTNTGLITLNLVDQLTPAPVICPILPNTNYSLSLLFRWTSASVTADWGFTGYPIHQIILCNAVSGGSPVAPFVNKTFYLNNYTPTPDGITIDGYYTTTNIFNSETFSILQFLNVDGTFINGDITEDMTIDLTAYLTPI